MAQAPSGTARSQKDRGAGGQKPIAHIVVAKAEPTVSMRIPQGLEPVSGEVGHQQAPARPQNPGRLGDGGGRGFAEMQHLVEGHRVDRLRR